MRATFLGLVGLALGCSTPQAQLVGPTDGTSGVGTAGAGSVGSTTQGSSTGGSNATGGSATTGGNGVSCTMPFGDPILIPTGVGQTYQVTTSPLQIPNHPLAVGDLNGDGNPDIAIGDNGAPDGPGDLGVLLGNGDGTFQPAIHVNAGQPDGLRIAALEQGDNNSLAVMDSSSGEVLVFDLAATGVIQSSALLPNLGCSYPGQLGERYMTAADFNRDGWPDLLLGANVVGSCGDGVGLFLGGDGGWSPNASWSSPDDALSVSVGDFDRDGLLDLVVSLDERNGPSFLKGRGDGTFAPAVSIGGIALASWAGDLNGDGHLDLLTFSIIYTGAPPPTYMLSTILGVGDGSFTPGPQLSLGNSYPQALVDLNGDGRLDYVGVWYSDGVHVALGKGDGAFGQETVLAIAGAASTANPSHLVVADINHDGWPDLIVNDFWDGNVSVFLNQCGVGGR
jgi:hypothetical protein